MTVQHGIALDILTVVQGAPELDDWLLKGPSGEADGYIVNGLLVVRFINISFSFALLVRCDSFFKYSILHIYCLLR